MQNVSTIALTLSLSAVTGCALPIETGQYEVAIDDVDVARVFESGEGSDEGYHEAAPLDFSFVIDVAGPQVVLATLDASDSWSTGAAVWAEPGWLSDQLFVRRDADVHRVPVEVLMRLGEPFLGWNARGERCEGYLGEPSIIRTVAAYNVPDLLPEGMTLEDEVKNSIWRDDYTGAPSEALADPEVIWQIAAGQTFFVATWESDDDCRPSHWGSHPEHEPIVFEAIDAGAFEAAALRAFRAHPEYEAIQESHDESRRFALQNGHEDWYPDGPWDVHSFAARAFRAPDGRTLVVASAGEGCGSSRLGAVYDVAADGSLTLRPGRGASAVNGVILESEQGALHDLTTTDLSPLSEDSDSDAYFFSVAPFEMGCSC